ncbi:unnamed protein product [Strongylus vulgaris]|uniref:Uncharacterized protein n=1 Tax=Strongylus vulgaris TaxID=40348 RepID=A0A3P7IIG2_STRVU|nr:unnamed protein product [Strongylus vulgaris]
MLIIRMAAMGMATVFYFGFLTVQVLSTCPCAQYLASPCTCQAGITPYCTCMRPLLQYSCPCSPLASPCHTACQHKCTSMCASSHYGSNCPSSCSFSCLQSCMHQQAIPIHVIMNRLVASSDQCIPLCRKSCEKSCTPMVSAATCVPLCKQPCEQRCSQFTPASVTNCIPMCRPGCSPHCIMGQRLFLIQSLGQPGFVPTLIAPLQIITNLPALVSGSFIPKSSNSSSTSESQSQQNQSSSLGVPEATRNYLSPGAPPQVTMESTLFPGSAVEQTSHSQTTEDLEPQGKHSFNEQHESLLASNLHMDHLTESTVADAVATQSQGPVSKQFSSSLGSITRSSTHFTFTPLPNTSVVSTGSSSFASAGQTQVPPLDRLFEGAEHQRPFQMQPFIFTISTPAPVQRCVAACMPLCDPKCIKEKEQLTQHPLHASSVTVGSGQTRGYEYELGQSSVAGRKTDVHRFHATSLNNATAGLAQ